MSILARLTEKSWEASSDSEIDSKIDRPSPGAVGLAVYFAVALVMFSLLIAAYLMRMGLHAAMGHGGEDWVPMPDPPLLWINSVILIGSSLAWEVARRAAMRDGQRQAVQASVAGAALGLCFLVGQWLLWRHYQAAGFYLSANPANAFFYLLTALHGCHIIGGLVAAGRVLGVRLEMRLWRIRTGPHPHPTTQAWYADGRSGGAVVRHRIKNAPFRAFFQQPLIAHNLRHVRLCAIYWHFLLLIWILLVGLLVST